ncbi:LysM peptidoglycan-binding domain-containing protein [Catellatospora tritici]|uniref:LysM peptidoglycan-binding domain-containing protein n=1 Tax=Catellatospora tritici TaxID=2851566 RepID=UPI001C2D3AA3|nr:LysM domain-containing protein [Catellatospora tritici]MBV1851744.1 LysM peptidoglycan-binding domain-containing protein [Catellatospora tritici]
MAIDQRTRPHWFVRLLAGLAALALLAAVLVGAPMALLKVAGNPLPDHVPSVDELATLLTSPDDGRLFLRLLALAGWFAWFTFAISVLLEIPARLRGRRARRIPGLGVQQRIVAALIGAMIAVFAGTSMATAATASVPAPMAARAVAVVPVTAPVGALSIGGSAVLALGPATAVPQPGALVPVAARPPTDLVRLAPAHQLVERPVYVVRKGDYLGCIAERFTGDFDRYHQIAALNPQLVRNPNHIEPGWRLVLPADAYDRGSARHATGKLLLPAVEDPSAPPPTTQTPPPTSTPAPAPTPSAVPAPAVRPSLPATSPTAIPSPVVTTPASTAPANPPGLDETDPGTGHIKVLATGAGLALAGVMAGHMVVRRRIRRMHQLRVRRKRRRGPRSAFAFQVREVPRHQAADRLDAGLRHLTLGLRGRAPWEMPDVAAAWEHGGDLAIILAAPCADPPEPFEVQWPNTWSLPSAAWLPDAHTAPSLLPGLLKVGAWPQGGQLYVDGERTGLLTLVGDPQRCDDLLRFLAAEVATAAWADEASVVVAGFSGADVRALTALNDRVRFSSSVSDALARIGRRAAANAAVLHDTQTADTVTARINNVTTWATHVLFIADPWGEHTEQLRDLDALLADLGRVGVVVVATHPTGTRWAATIGGDGGVHMSWLAVTDITACGLTSEGLITHAEGQAEAARIPQQPAGARHRLHT